MFILLILINLANLEYSLVIYFANLEFNLFSKIQTFFWRMITILNFITIIKLIYILYNIIFISLFNINLIKRELLKLILNYSSIFKKIIIKYLIYTILKNILHLATLLMQI